MAKKNHIKTAQASLESIMELLGPYLPKTNLEEPDPGRDWSKSVVDSGETKKSGSDDHADES